MTGVQTCARPISEMSDIYDVHDLGGGRFHFVPKMLMPYNWPEVIDRYIDWEEGIVFKNIPPLVIFAYREESQYRAILPEVPGHPYQWDSTDPETLGMPQDWGGGRDRAAIIMPFDGITVPLSATAVRFTLSWDLDGIVEVYDNYTPEDTSDDIIVFARNFWERLSLIPVVIENN